MTDRITTDKAVAFGRTYGFSLYPVDGCATGSILRLSEPIYSHLHETGRIAGDYWTREFDSSEILREGICLVYRTDAQDDLWDDLEPENITPLLSHMHFAEYVEGPVPTLRLISKTSFWKILPKYLDGSQNQHLPGLEPSEPCRLKVKPYVKDMLRETPDFSGRTMVCDYMSNNMPCGIPSCYSEFAWTKNGVVLIYMSGGCDSLTRVWLLPRI